MIQDVQITSSAAPVVSSGCACCSPQDTVEHDDDAVVVAAAAPGSGEYRAGYAVTGMTCGHCVSAVRAALSDLDGITSVEVDLTAGATSHVHISATTAIDDAAVSAAIEEAGYIVTTTTQER